MGSIAVEHRIAYLRADQIRHRLGDAPVVYIPIGPLEWHGPHLPYGTDPLNAEHVAAGVCAKTGGLLWPTTFWGTERERSPEVVEFLGFERGRHIVGMDFPGISVPSSYCPEEVFGIVVREILNEVLRIGAKIAVLVNGHGGKNHIAVMQRLEAEFNGRTDLHVRVRLAFSKDISEAGSIGHIGHASSDETSLMMALTKSVDLAKLPGRSRPLKYKDHAVVDSHGFDGEGPADKTVPPEDDPRVASTRLKGQRLYRRIIQEIAEEMQSLIKEYR